MGTFLIYLDRGSEYRWTLYAANNRKIADSGEGYKNYADCEDAVKLVKALVPYAALKVNR